MAPGADIGIEVEKGGRFTSYGGGGSERPSPAVGELELFRWSDVSEEGENMLRAGKLGGWALLLLLKFGSGPDPPLLKP